MGLGPVGQSPGGRVSDWGRRGKHRLSIRLGDFWRHVSMEPMSRPACHVGSAAQAFLELIQRQEGLARARHLGLHQRHSGVRRRGCV